MNKAEMNNIRLTNAILNITNIKERQEVVDALLEYNEQLLEFLKSAKGSLDNEL